MSSTELGKPVEPQRLGKKAVNELTAEQVAQAEKCIGVSHPVLAVIDQQLPIITKHAEVYSQIKTIKEQQSYIANNYGFLADAFVEAGPYTLKPMDIIAIWSRAREIFSDSKYHRYFLAQMVSSAYAVQGAENPKCSELPRQYLETRRFPPDLAGDKKGLRHVQGKLDEIRTSLDAIVARNTVSKTPILGDIRENFANGFMPLYLKSEMHCEDALEQA